MNHEEEWQKLLLDLEQLSEETEILFVISRKKKEETEEKGKIRWIFAQEGRAQQMNAGAKEAKNPY